MYPTAVIKPLTRAVAVGSPLLRLRRASGVSGLRVSESLGLVSMMTAPSSVVLSMNPRGRIRFSAMMPLFLLLPEIRI